MMRKIERIILSFVFLMFIGLLWVNQLLPVIKDSIDTENRAKASRPKLDVNRLDFFPDSYSKYYEDHFIPRNRLMKVHTWLSRDVFKKNLVSKDVLLGKDNWMFHASNGLKNYRGTYMFSQNELGQLCDEFNYRFDTLNKLGTKVFVFILPDKFSVYSEKLPSYIKKAKYGRTQQIIDELNKCSPVRFFTIKDSLLAKKDSIPLFFKYDTHWNGFGGFWAAKAITSILKENGVKCFNHTPESYVLETSIRERGNLEGMLADSKEYPETAYTMVPIFTGADTIDTIKYKAPENFSLANQYQYFYTNNNPELDNVLFFRDSFGWFVMPFLRNNFNQTSFIFDAWKYKANLDIVKNEEPDVVVYLILENLFHNVLSNLSCQE